ncbi:MAG TPA: hypothetical protein PK836_03135 [Syntrophales bacterium]|nr:hypothetical protein [Syntrophales bacterium]HPC00657.1 hypothetical protein [Syntrophales bacterium]HRS86347.1 hypothetical protein [Syntrophales bacterium]
MRFFRSVFALTLVLALVAFLGGCAKPPEAEKAAAKAAMDAAVGAGADKYAAPDFAAAKKAWEGAEAQMGEKKYEEAKQGYLNAKAAFDKAAAAAATGKTAAVSEATAALAVLEEGWKELSATAKKLEKKLKDQKDAWEADVKAFEEGLKAAKDAVNKDPLGAKKKAGELKALLDKWDAAFKELAAVPEKPAKKGKKK